MNEARLIDANALKENLRQYFTKGEALYQILTIIDNAPTVAVNCKDCDGYEAGYSAGLKDAERPQGEWIDYDNTFYKCPECGYLLEKCCPQCQNKVILPKGGAE